MSSPILETPRLVLREMTPDDLDFVAAMLADPEVMRYYPRCYSRDESQQWIERQLKRYDRHGHGLWLAIEKSTGQPVGQVGLLLQQVDGIEEKEVAYLIHRPFWRRGLATEAALACRDHAFTVFSREVVIALIRPENVPSQGVARKLGMAPRAGTVLHSGLVHHVFAISRAEWLHPKS
jgi:RimJ/RimL family protein N-acetyltransferase